MMVMCTNKQFLELEKKTTAIMKENCELWLFTNDKLFIEIDKVPEKLKEKAVEYNALRNEFLTIAKELSKPYAKGFGYI